MKLEETYLHTGEVGADTAVQVQEEVHAWVLAHSQESAKQGPHWAPHVHEDYVITFLSHHVHSMLMSGFGQKS